MEERGYLIWERAWGSDGCERYGPVSRTMGDGCAGRAPADDSGAGAPGAGTVVRSDPRLDRSGYRRGTGTLDGGWPPSARVGPQPRAVRWCPPALEAAQQAALKGAVQELPANSGMELANCGKCCQYVALRYQSRSTCLNHHAKADVEKRLRGGVRRPVGRGAVVLRYSSRRGHLDSADAELRGKWVLRGKPSQWWTRAARAPAQLL